MESENTLPKLLAKRALTDENVVALRQKNLGIWNETTWSGYYKKVEQLSLVLSDKYAFQKGEKLAIIGENRAEWLFSQMAAQVLGGISVGIYQESLPEQLVYYLNDCQARIVVVEGQEQVDKLLEIKDQIPLVEHIIFYNKQGMRHYNQTILSDFYDDLTIGENLRVAQPDFFRLEIERPLGTDTAIIAYSAATTGDPKGVMLTHNNLISAAGSLNSVDKMEKNDDYFSFLPLAWIHEQIISIAMPLKTGVVINFPEKAHTVLVDLREIGPHTLLAPPRVYQTLRSSFTTRIEGASWFKRKVYQFFKRYGDKVANANLNKKPLSFWDKFMFNTGDWLVFSAIRDHLGLARIKRAYVAGAALETEAYQFYHSIGVNVKQSYGGTEVAGIAFVHRDDDIQVGSAGAPLPNTDVRIGESGDIFVRNPAIFSAYLNWDDEKQADDGWITLGDCGYIGDNGHLYILDRQEDVVTAADGESIYPRVVENQLKASQYIQEAVCFGKNRPFMTAILNIDMNSVGRWADKNRIVYTTYSDLSRHPEVIKFIENEVQGLMKEIPQSARVKRFAILHKQLNANDGELTRTLKVRRKFVEDSYASLIDGLYSNSKEVLMYGEDHEAMDEVSLQVVQLETGQEVA